MHSPGDRSDLNSSPWLKPATIIFLGSTPFAISASTIEDTLAEDSSNPTLSFVDFQPSNTNRPLKPTSHRS